MENDLSWLTPHTLTSCPVQQLNKKLLFGTCHPRFYNQDSPKYNSPSKSLQLLKRRVLSWVFVDFNVDAKPFRLKNHVTVTRQDVPIRHTYFTLHSPQISQPFQTFQTFQCYLLTRCPSIHAEIPRRPTLKLPMPWVSRFWGPREMVEKGSGILHEFTIWVFP